MTFEKQFAQRLRDIRVDMGLTQSDLAQKIGVTTSCICYYENAKRMPSLKTASIISQVFDMSLDDLVPCASYEIPVDPCQTGIFDLIGEEDE